MATRTQPSIPQALALLVGYFILLCALYHSAISAPFFSIDDRELLFVPQLLPPYDLRTLLTILTPGTHVDYYPMRDLSYLIDHLVFGYSPAGYRLHEILLASELSTLVVLILRSLKVPLWIATSATVLWICHPAHSELICWISARKDLLALVYGAWATFLFLQAIKRRSLALSALSIAAFLFCILSKASLVALPVIGGIALALFPKARTRIGVLTLSLGTLLAAAASIFTSWFYSHVNDMRYAYSLGYRLTASASAFAKMLGAWVIPRWNIVDPSNLPPWASLNIRFFWPGVFLWGALGLLLVSSAVRINRKFAVIGAAAALLYFPVAGIFFPHRNFFSVRYLEPVILALLIGATVLLSKWLSRNRNSRLLQASALVTLIALTSMTSAEARLWSDPLQVIDKSLEDQPSSLQLKILRYGAVRGSGSLTTQLSESIESACKADDLETRRICVDYWGMKAQETARRDLALAQDYLTRGTWLSPSDPPGTAHIYEAAQLAHSIALGDLDLSTLRTWEDVPHFSTTMNLRLLDWVARCLLSNPAAARQLLRSEIESHLIQSGVTERFVATYAAPRYRTRLTSCLAP